MQRKWQVLGITSVAVFMSFLDVTIVNIAFPDIRASFAGTSLAGLSWILTAYNIVFAALLVPAGRLADRIGRRRTFLARALDLPCRLGRRGPRADGRGPRRGPGRAGRRAPRRSCRPRSRSCCPSSRSASARPRPAIWGATGAIAAAVGPSLGGVLVDVAGWRWVFFVNLVIGLRRSSRPAACCVERREAEPGPLPDAVGVAPAHRGRRACSRSGSSRARTGAGAAAACSARSRPGSCCCSPSRARSARHPSPVVDPALFRVRSFSVSIAGMFAFALGVLRLPARQRPVSHRAVALLGPHRPASR